MIFFYSGHGNIAGGEGYVTLADGRFTRANLYAILEASPAHRNHVIIDACRSYFLVYSRGPGGRRTAVSTPLLPRVRANTGFLLSTSSDRDSHEWERFGAGIFSHEVRSALRGGADLDRDGAISYAEVGAFLTTANAAIPNDRFRPDLAVQPPAENTDPLATPILRWQSAARSLVIPAESGHVLVETAAGERLADVHHRASTPLRLRLPAQRRIYVRSASGRPEYQIAADGPSQIELAALTPGPPRVCEKGAIHEAFRWRHARRGGVRKLCHRRRGKWRRNRRSLGAWSPLRQRSLLAPDASRVASIG